MKAGFFPMLAVSGMRKNRQLYTPYLLACTGIGLLYKGGDGATLSLIGVGLVFISSPFWAFRRSSAPCAAAPAPP